MAPLPRALSVASWSVALSAAAFAGCGAPPPAAPHAAPPPAKTADFDPCKDSKPPPHPYHGILRNARCEQEMFLTMSTVADSLGVECRFCHVPLVVNGKEVPKKEDYPVMTDRKQVANWMSRELMQSIKPADGSKIQCKHCHVDEQGKAVAKILGTPRSREKAMEWMNLVMVNRFVTLDGQKLKCKHCHQDNVGSPGFQTKIILTEHLPPHQHIEEAPAPIGPGGAASGPTPHRLAAIGQPPASKP